MRGQESLEKIISYILTASVLVGLTLYFAGLASYYFENKMCLEISINDQSSLQLDNFLNQFNQLNSYIVLSTSILVVMFTPYIRVLTSIIYFLKNKDYKYSVLALFVFSALTILFLIR